MFVHFLLSIASAFGSYNENCLKLLLPPRPPAVERYYRFMVDSVRLEPFTASLPFASMRPIDYETIFDLTHDMPLIAVFADGSRLTLQLDIQSIEKLRDKLGRVNVLTVLYLPAALEKIRFVLKQACIELNHTGCDSYDTYNGLIENRARAFTRAEEHALKWATIFQTPTYLSAAMFRRTSTNPADMNRRIEIQRNIRLVASVSILKGVLGDANGTAVYHQFAAGYINDAFDRLINMTADNVTIFKPRPK